MIKQPVRTNVSDLYQRSYTWRPEAETARLMGDIQDLLKDRSATHFLGIIISMETDVSAMFKEIQIVDGQQRLTTSFIFLLALKRVALEHNNENIAGMIDDYYLYNRHSSQEALLRLKPAVGNDDTFAHLYYGSYKDLDHNQKETPVYRNFDYIYRRVEEFSKSWSLAEILDTLGRLDVLSFPLSEDDNAQQIFESINSTGAPLTSSDLIRNYILMNDSSGVQERNCTGSRWKREFRIRPGWRSSSAAILRERPTRCRRVVIRTRRSRAGGMRRMPLRKTSCGTLRQTAGITMPSTTVPMKMLRWRRRCRISAIRTAGRRHRSFLGCLI